MRRTPLLAVVGALVLVAPACQVRTTVAIDVEEDGSGTVYVTVDLDADAARRLGDPATALRLADLTEAGWDVDEPSRTEGGAVTLRASRGFASPAQLPTVLDEVGGPGGVFRDVELTVEDGFGQVDRSFRASVHLTGSLDQFSDEALAGALGGLALGRTPEELVAAGSTDPEAAVLIVSLRLPGGEPTTNGERELDHRSIWTFPMTGGEPTEATLTASATTSQRSTRVLLVAAGIGLLAGAAAGVVALSRRRA